MTRDEATPEEARWFRRLVRVINDMPPSVELQVHQSAIQMNENGAREAAFLRQGHADSVPEISSFRTSRVYPCSESI
jgi:predicted RNA-binding protein with PUA-like domain